MSGWFKVGQVIGSKVIKSVAPKLTKGESTKVWSQKLRGKFKKELEEASKGIDKALKDTGQLLQKIKKIPITKSGVSKGKDIK